MLSSWASFASTDFSRELFVGHHNLVNFIDRLRIIFLKIVCLTKNIAVVIVIDSTVAVGIEAGDSIAHLVDVDTLQGGGSKRDKREEDDDEVHFTFCLCLFELVDFLLRNDWQLSVL